MFGAVMSDSRRIKPLLEYTLGIKIKKIKSLEKQKTLTPKYDSKGIRLDLIVVVDLIRNAPKIEPYEKK